MSAPGELGLLLKLFKGERVSIYDVSRASPIATPRMAFIDDFMYIPRDRVDLDVQDHKVQGSRSNRDHPLEPSALAISTTSSSRKCLQPDRDDAVKLYYQMQDSAGLNKREVSASYQPLQNTAHADLRDQTQVTQAYIQKAQVRTLFDTDFCSNSQYSLPSLV